MDEIPQPGFFISASKNNTSFTNQQQSLPTNSAFLQNGIQFAIPEQQSVQNTGINSSTASGGRTSFFSTQRKSRQTTAFVDQKNENIEEEKITKNKDIKLSSSLRKEKDIYIYRNTLQYKINTNNYKKGVVSQIKNNTSIQEQRDIEEKDAIDRVNDLFGVTTTSKPVILIRSSDEVARLVANLLTGQLVDKTNSKSPTSHGDFERFKSQLITIMKSLQPEDIGILLERLIFGSLLSRSKMSGAGAPAALLNFPKISDGLANLDRNGGIGSPNIVNINSIIDYVNSNNCSLYRQNVSIVNQVKNIISLLAAVKSAKIQVCFPVSISIQDKEKSISLNGLPTLDNLKNFFPKENIQVTKSNTKTKNDSKLFSDMGIGEYDEQEDRFDR